MDVAAGVPFTALPPAVPVAEPTPLVVTWHMLDAPRTDAAFAAALPLAELPAWRVHLSMPLCGRRMRDGSLDAIIELANQDMLLSYMEPFVQQAAAELPAVLAAVRARLSIGTGPVALVGGSLGGATVLQALARTGIAVAAAAVINPAIRATSVVPQMEILLGRSYDWTERSRRAAARLDFVAAADEIAAAQPPVLVVSGEHDYPALRTDAADLVAALRERYAEPDRVRLESVPGLAHPLAEEPGMAPAPQLPVAKAVDERLTRWLLRQL